MKYFRDYRDDSYNRHDHKETKASAFDILCAINQSDEHFHEEFLSGFSINLLVVYRESVNLIGYITRRLSADSHQL